MSTERPNAQHEPTERESRLYGMLCHLLALAGFIGIPFGNILGPLVIWLIKKDMYPFVDDQGKESINFQISLTIYALVAGALTIIVIGIPLLVAVGIFGLVEIILAAIRANEGAPYRYPLSMKFLK